MILKAILEASLLLTSLSISAEPHFLYTGSPRSLWTFNLRWLFTSEKWIKWQFPVKNGLSICEFKIRGPKYITNNEGNLSLLCFWLKNSYCFLCFHFFNSYIDWKKYKFLAFFSELFVERNFCEWRCFENRSRRSFFQKVCQCIFCFKKIVSLRIVLYKI